MKRRLNKTEAFRDFRRLQYKITTLGRVRRRLEKTLKKSIDPTRDLKEIEMLSIRWRLNGVYEHLVTALIQLEQFESLFKKR